MQNTVQNAIVKLEQIEKIVAEHESDLREASAKASELGIQKSAEQKARIEEMQDLARTLRIGIVGRMKAGKSSFLNALLFDGKSVLPKAATPMTAALTVLSYGDSPYAEVDFYTSDDRQNIRNEAEYAERAIKDELAKAQKPGKTLDENARKNITKKALETAGERARACWEQWQELKNLPEPTENPKQIKFELSNLNSALAPYVGANGKFTPLTKSVRICLPFDSLKDVEIVDTPGLNDPVISRDERTREFLKNCDVTLVLSPAGQFLNNEDLGLLDRIDARGVSEARVIASKFDSELFGDVSEKSEGNFHEACKIIKSMLESHMNKTLKGKFDFVLEKCGGELIYNSGICHSIAAKLESQSEDALDETEDHVLNNLLRDEYPDYFEDEKAAISNLKKLANMERIKDDLEAIKDKKEQILAENLAKISDELEHKVQAYRETLVDIVEEHKHKVENTDYADVETSLDKLCELEENAGDAVDEQWGELVSSIRRDLQPRLMDKIKNIFNAANSQTDAAESEKTVRRHKDGNWYCLWLDGKDWTETVEVINAAKVRSTLMDAKNDIQNELSNEMFIFLDDKKKFFKGDLIKTIRRKTDAGTMDKYLLPNLKSAVNIVVGKLELPEPSYADKNPPSASSNTLTGYNKDRFRREVDEWLTSFKDQVQNDVRANIQNLTNELKSVDMKREIFTEVENAIKKFQDDLKNKAEAIANLDRIKAKFDKVK